MPSFREKPWTLLLLGTLLGCAPSTAQPEEATRSQSSPFEIDDAAGRASWQHTRPTFDGLTLRTSVRLKDGRVLVTGGLDPRTGAESSKAELFDPITETWTKLPFMHHELAAADGFLLNDGRVLILGVPLTSSNVAEIFDPQTQSWTDSDSLVSDIWNSEFGATLLHDGRLLVTGGNISALAFFFDPKTLQWSPAPPMKHPRVQHSSTLLADGRVLLAGGIGFSSTTGMIGDVLISEIFDSATNQWSDAAPLNDRHSEHQTVLLTDGRVMLLDGFTTEVEIFDPTEGSSGFWFAGVPFSMGADTLRLNFASVGLPDDRVLVVGGYSADNVENDGLIYSPTLQTWESAGRLNVARQGATATLLQDGRVLIAGGEAIYSNNSAPPIRAAELFVTDPSVWTPLPDQGDKPATHSATRLADGRVLLAGWSPNNNDSFIFSPDTNTFAKTASLLHPRTDAAIMLLADGRVMVVGGTPSGGMTEDTSQSVEFFDPATETWAAGPSPNEVYPLAAGVRLEDGRVLVVSTDVPDGLARPLEVFDPRTNAWQSFDTLPLTMFWSDVAVMADGRVALSGFSLNKGDATVVTLDPSDGSNESITLTDTYSYALTKLMPLVDGRVLVSSYVTYSKVGFLDPLAQQWDFLGTTSSLPPFASFPRGAILWAGSGQYPPRTGIFDVQAERFTMVGSPYGPYGPETHRLTPLLDGRMLLTGPAATGLVPGAFLYGKPNAAPCTDSFECTSGYCVDGYCCNEACDDSASCNACARYRGASANGTCTKVLDCAPYHCAHIEVEPAGQDATCTTACARAADCAPGFVCNLQGQCVEPKNVDIDGGCATVPVKTDPTRQATFFTVLGLAALGCRRRLARAKTRRR